jgi:hypothetical protein
MSNATDSTNTQDRDAQSRCALSHGSACMAVAMPIGKKMLLRDAPPILWRSLQEDLHARVKQLSEVQHGGLRPTDHGPESGPQTQPQLHKPQN